MAKRIPQYSEVRHLPLQGVRLGVQVGTRNSELAIPAEHSGNLGEAEAR